MWLKSDCYIYPNRSDKKQQRKTQTDEGKATGQMEELERSNVFQGAQQLKSPSQLVNPGRKKRTGYPQKSGLRWGDRGYCLTLSCHYCHYQLNLKLKFGSSRFHTSMSGNCIDEDVITGCWGHCQLSVIKVAENSEETEGKGTRHCKVQESSDTGMKWRAGLQSAKKWVYEHVHVVTRGHFMPLLIPKGPGNKTKDSFIKAKNFNIILKHSGEVEGLTGNQHFHKRDYKFGRFKPTAAMSRPGCPSKITSTGKGWKESLEPSVSAFAAVVM